MRRDPMSNPNHPRPGRPAMAERGAVPQVSDGRRRVLGMIRSFTSPLLPDDYLELVNPLWSTRELRGRIERIEREAPNAATVLIKPGWEWPRHRPGQYLRLGIEVDGVHHWRAYSLTSDPGRAGRLHLDHPEARRGRQGLAVPVLRRAPRHDRAARRRRRHVRAARPAAAAKLLFISAGSGITPIMSMLRAIAREGKLEDVVHVHCARTRRGSDLRERAARACRRQPRLSACTSA